AIAAPIRVWSAISRLAKLRTATFCEAASASWLDWISNWSPLAACARKPGAISKLFMSTGGGGGGGGGVVWQPASSIAPPSRIASFLIIFPLFIRCGSETGQQARGSYGPETVTAIE